MKRQMWLSIPAVFMLALVFGSPSARAQTAVTLVAPGGARAPIDALIPASKRKPAIR